MHDHVEIVEHQFQAFEVHRLRLLPRQDRRDRRVFGPEPLQIFQHHRKVRGRRRRGFEHSVRVIADGNHHRGLAGIDFGNGRQGAQRPRGLVAAISRHKKRRIGKAPNHRAENDPFRVGLG